MPPRTPPPGSQSRLFRGGVMPRKLALCCYVMLPLCMLLAPPSYQLHFTTALESSSMWVHRGARGEGVQLPGCGQFARQYCCFYVSSSLCACCLLRHPISYISRKHLSNPAPCGCPGVRGEKGYNSRGCGQFERNCYCVAMFCSRCVLRLLLHPINYISQKRPLNPAPRWCPEV